MIYNYKIFAAVHASIKIGKYFVQTDDFSVFTTCVNNHNQIVAFKKTPLLALLNNVFSGGALCSQ